MRNCFSDIEATQPSFICRGFFPEAVLEHLESPFAKTDNSTIVPFSFFVQTLVGPFREKRQSNIGPPMAARALETSSAAW
jgi:hypothetical protein